MPCLLIGFQALWKGDRKPGKLKRSLHPRASNIAFGWGGGQTFGDELLCGISKEAIISYRDEITERLTKVTANKYLSTIKIALRGLLRGPKAICENYL